MLTILTVRYHLAALLAVACATLAPTAANAQPLETELVQVGALKVELAVGGPLSGPTVVFENGLDMNLSTWRRVAALLAQDARLIAYNRPGQGSSADDGGRRDTSAPVCAHLRAVLAEAGARPPYVLVGHSLGGLYAQACARRMPHDVVGLVLVDPVVRGQEQLLRQHDRLGAVLFGALQSTLPPAAARELRGAAAVQAELAALPVYANGPVLTLVAGRDGITESRAYKDARRRAMREQARDYPRGETIELADGGHMLVMDEPRAIADAVLRVLGAPAETSPRERAAAAEERSLRLPLRWVVNR